MTIRNVRSGVGRHALNSGGSGGQSPPGEGGAGGGRTLLSSPPFFREATPPWMVCGWTIGALVRRFVLANGRIGLRRSATRAPVGRLHARGRGLVQRALVLLYFLRMPRSPVPRSPVPRSRAALGDFAIVQIA